MVLYLYKMAANLDVAKITALVYVAIGVGNAPLNMVPEVFKRIEDSMRADILARLQVLLA